MKSLSRSIKGILLSLMAVMILNTTLTFTMGTRSLFAPTHAYAADGDTGGGEKKSFAELMASIKPVSETEKPQESKQADDALKKLAMWANWGHRLFAPMINFFAFKIGGFLGTDYIFEGAMGTMLHKIWVISRNLVNIIFIFILLWLALNTIFNPKFPLSDLRDKLLLFAALLVAVNFSWLGTKVVLDAANVTTHIVFAIPSGISNPPTADTQCQINNPDEPARGLCYPTAIIAPADMGTKVPLLFEDTEGDSDHCAQAKEAYNDAYLQNGDNKGQPNPGAKKENQKLWKRTSICMENLNLINYDQNTAVIYLTYGMARIQNLVRTVGNPNFEEFAVSTLVSLMIQLAYMLSLLALFLALIIRTATLWFFVGFSPFLVLIYYFSKAGEANPLEELKGKFDFTAFAQWAFVPAKVGAIFAVSFIMISAGQSMKAVDLQVLDKLQTKSGFVAKIPQIESLFGGMDTLYQFIWLLMSLAVLWMGVFAVLSKIDTISVVTNKIRDFGTQTFQKVAALPYKAPIIPLGKGEKKTSVREMFQGLDPRRLIDEYTEGKGKMQDVRDFNDKAKKVRIAPLMAQVTSGPLSRAQGNRIASSYGFRDLTHMMEMEQKTLEAGFKTSVGHKGNNAADLYTALQKANKSTPQARQQQAELEARAKARADKEVGVNQPPTETPPAVKPAETPPAAPPAK